MCSGAKAGPRARSRRRRRRGTGARARRPWQTSGERAGERLPTPRTHARIFMHAHQPSMCCRQKPMPTDRRPIRSERHRMRRGRARLRAFSSHAIINGGADQAQQSCISPDISGVFASANARPSGDKATTTRAARAHVPAREQTRATAYGGRHTGAGIARIQPRSNHAAERCSAGTEEEIRQAYVTTV
jgi:hypothetical protein